MEIQIKKSREEKILASAEKICFQKGYPNFKMSDISKEANCSKTTLYSYFKSKETLYMAITHKAFITLLDYYYDKIEDSSKENGYETSYNLFYSYIKFSEDYYDYYSILLDYLTFIRKTTRDSDSNNLMLLTLKDNVYLKKVMNIHNIPRHLIVTEIKRGQQDGSITNSNKPEMIYLTIWSLIIGYSKLNPNSGNTIFNVNHHKWKAYILENVENILLSN